MALLRFFLGSALLLGLSSRAGAGLGGPPTDSINEYIRPYADTNNFSGAFLVTKDGKQIIAGSYGLANRETNTANDHLTTRFHVASTSMQFTAAAVLRLCDQGKLALDTSVKELLPTTPGAEAITVQDLLTERSGLPDINELPDYADILQHHQTPEQLVARVAGKPLLFPPGSKFLHEEHSAYNLLALLIEKKTGLPFAEAIRNLVFEPMGMKNSSVDDDSLGHADFLARGYQPKGMDEIEPTTPIHWSAKAGNASVCTTVDDEARFVTALFGDSPETSSLRRALLTNKDRVGYGWFKKSASSGSNDAAYYMNGRAPGFASFVLFQPQEKLIVVIFSNIYSSATTTIGNDIANIVLRKPYTAFKPAKALPRAEAEKMTGKFQFGPDFYQKNAIVEVRADEQILSLLWPSGESSALIPLGHDAFIDRAYWQDVKIERDPAGRPVALRYDKFRGLRVP